MLVASVVHFQRNHDLRILLELFAPVRSLDLKKSDVIGLNRYSVEGRYPGDWEPISELGPTEALEAARKVRDAVKPHLPSESIEDS